MRSVDKRDDLDLLPARLEHQRGSWCRACVVALAGSNAGKIGGQAARPISTRKLRILRYFYIVPINHVVYVGSSGAFDGIWDT